MRNKHTPVNINSLESLQAEKWALKARLRQRELDLQARLNQLPVEVIKATAGKVVPFFLNKRVAATSWVFIKGVMGFVFRRRGARSGNGSIFAAVKELGIAALAKEVYGLFSR